MVPGPPYRSTASAQYFLEAGRNEGIGVNAQSLHKLTFLAHGLHLARNLTPLISSPFYGWVCGPISAELGAIFPFTQNSLNELLDNPTSWSQFSIPRTDTQSLICHDCVWRQFKNFLSIQLSAMLLAYDPPWRATVIESAKPADVPLVPITDSDIQNYFSSHFKFFFPRERSSR